MMQQLLNMARTGSTRIICFSTLKKYHRIGSSSEAKELLAEGERSTVCIVLDINLHRFIVGAICTLFHDLKAFNEKGANESFIVRNKEFSTGSK